MSGQRDKGKSGELGLGAASATLAIGAELAAGAGALGVVAGGVAPLAVPVVRSLVAYAQRRRDERMGWAVAQAADILDAGVEIFAERSEGDDERAELLARVLEASARSTFDAKLRALAQVLADGFQPDGDAGEALILAAAVDALEGPHVAMLRFMEEEPTPPNDLLPNGLSDWPGWPRDLLVQRLPTEVGALLDGLLAVLGGHGLLRDASAASLRESPGPTLWRITDLGRRCLKLLGHGGSADFRDF